MASDGKFTTLHRVGAKPTYVIAETEAKALLAKQHGPARVLIVPGVKPTRDAVAYAVQWCRATRERRSPFTTEMDRQSPELAAWAKGGYQGISWPKGRAVPTKEMIAAFLERKLAGGDH
jgi:hypothetical protein